MPSSTLLSGVLTRDSFDSLRVGFMCSIYSMVSLRFSFVSNTYREQDLGLENYAQKELARKGGSECLILSYPYWMREYSLLNCLHLRERERERGDPHLLQTYYVDLCYSTVRLHVFAGFVHYDLMEGHNCGSSPADSSNSFENPLIGFKCHE